MLGCISLLGGKIRDPCCGVIMVDVMESKRAGFGAVFGAIGEEIRASIVG